MISSPKKNLVPFSPVVSERFNCESLQWTTDAKLQQYLTWPLQIRYTTLMKVVSHNWMTLFREWGDGRELLSPKGGSSRYMTTLNEEYKCCVTYCSPLASVVCTLLDFYLLLWNHLANWNWAWYECSLNGFLQNLCCCFKRGCFHNIYGF
jgi:hypothetical protein